MRAHEFAVSTLEKDLKNPTGYDAIDHMMKTIAREHGITAKKLHDLFVEKHGKSPDEWTKSKLDELNFLGSQCTKDCSGHRAGYAWSRRKAGQVPNSRSPSFNKGAALQAAGK